MFETLSRSWEFAKISYRVIWDHKPLMVFPIFSTAAAAVVTASFLLPLWGMGTIEQWQQFIDGEHTGDAELWLYGLAFLFYFCNYFVIVFFNCALAACAFQVLRGEAPSVGYGMSMAGKRLPQIVGWALVSAVIGVLLKVVENSHKQAGAFIAAILGSAWTALTYFVVPVIVMEGVGPVKAFKRSVSTLRQAWGTALVGTFSMAMLTFLVMLPLLLIASVLVFLAFSSGSPTLLILGISAAVVLVVIGIAASSAADIVFTVLLYHWATGRTIPAEVDTGGFAQAFEVQPRE